MILGLLLAWSGLALAHRPHDVAVALAVPPDFASAGRAWLVQDPHDVSTLMVTLDFGAHWDFVAAPLQDDDIVDGAAEDGLIAFLALDGTLWTSADGETWEEQDLPVAVEEANELALAGERAVIATRDGLFVGDIADVAGMSQELAGEGVRGVAFAADDPEHVLAVTRDGALWRSTDGGAGFALVKDGMPGGRQPWSVAEVGGQVFAGTDHGIIFMDPSVRTWDLCETLPVTIGGTYATEAPDVFALGSGRLLATSGEQAVFVSDDACASWTLLDAGVDVEYGGVGNAQDAGEAFVGLYLEGDLGLVVGFQGVSWTADGGASWQDAHLLPEDYCKGVALSPDFPDDPTVFRAGYGGGVGWSADGGLSWSGSTTGVDSAYSNDVTPAADYSSSGIVYYAGSNDPYRSDDGGLTWTSLSVPMERARRFRDQGDVLYVLGEDDAGGVVGRTAWSTDRGETWTRMDAASDAADGAAPRDLVSTTVDGADALLLVTDQPAGLLLSTDGGETWTRVYEGAKETAAGAAAWPPGEGGRLLFASASSGVILSDDGGETWTSPATAPDGRVRDFAAADDGTLFVVNRAGQFWRSEDGGESWVEAGDPLGRAVFVVSVASDFAETGALLVGTQDGVFWSGDRGESWHRLPRYQRLEADTHLLHCYPVSGAEDCAAWEDAGAGLGGGYSLSAGDAVVFTFSGDAFRAVGEGEGSFAVSINGLDTARVALNERVSLETEGWQDVVLTAEDAMNLDLVETFASGEVLAVEGGGEGGEGGEGGDSGDSGDADDTAGETGTPPKDKGCGGCAQGRGAGSLLALGLALLGLRRRVRG